jgi:transposase
MKQQGNLRKFSITEEELQYLVADRMLTHREIAVRLGVNESTIHDWCRRFGIKRTVRQAPPPLVKMEISQSRLRDMVVNQHMSDLSIGKEIGVSNVTVARWRQRFGIRQPFVRKARGSKTGRRKLHLSRGQLEKLYVEDQLSQRDIAELHGVHQMTVSNWMYEYGIPSRPFGGRDGITLPCEELQKLYRDDKWTMEQLAAHFGCSESTVRKNLIDNNLRIDSKEVARRRLEKNRELYPHRVEREGYIQLRMPTHPDADTNGYVPEHRFVAETAIGRRVEHVEQVHHINLRKRDNQPENLAILPSKEVHARLHKYMERVAVYLCRLTDVRPEPFEFDAEVFWGGRYITRIDLIQEAQAASSVNQQLLNSAATEGVAVVVN